MTPFTSLIIGTSFTDFGKAEFAVKSNSCGIGLVNLKENRLGRLIARFAQCRPHQPPTETEPRKPGIDADRQDFRLTGGNARQDKTTDKRLGNERPRIGVVLAGDEAEDSVLDQQRMQFAIAPGMGEARFVDGGGLWQIGRFQGEDFEFRLAGEKVGERHLRLAPPQNPPAT